MVLFPCTTLIHPLYIASAPVAFSATLTSLRRVPGWYRQRWSGYYSNESESSAIKPRIARITQMQKLRQRKLCRIQQTVASDGSRRTSPRPEKSDIPEERRHGDVQRLGKFPKPLDRHGLGTAFHFNC